MQRTQVINFGAGPSALPQHVLEKAAAGLLNYNERGIGLTELSHRSKDFASLVDKLKELIRDQLQVPPTHHILFTQGGGSGQMSSVVLNLLARHVLLHPEMKMEDRTMDYVVTGSWSKKAADEARRLSYGAKVNIAVDARTSSSSGTSFDSIPPPSDWNLSEKAAFVYYCENETIDGVQFSLDDGFPFHLLKPDNFTPVVGDYSSSFMSRPIPRLADHAIIFAGAQKNIGPSGLTILIVRKDILVDVDAAAILGAPAVPITMSYKVLADHNSLYNTPPMFSMYVAQLVLQDIKRNGGIEEMKKKNERKKNNVYAALERYANGGMVSIKVKPTAQSWMNITFEILGDGRQAAFLERAEKNGLLQMKGHRSVGGIRVSLYNAITEEQVGKLIDFMNAFFE